MTTIVASRTQMAADRKVTDTDSNTRYQSRKIRRIGESLVGCAGDSATIARFVRWLEAGDLENKPKFGKDDELNALVLTPSGLYIYNTSCEPDEIDDLFYAVGTGAQAALGAMHMGADPQRAVEVAALVDNSTGGPIDVLNLYG